MRRPSTWVAHVARWRWWRRLLRRIVIIIENNNDDGDEKGFQPDNYPYLLIHGTEHHSLLLWKKKYDDHDQLTMTTTLKEAEAEEVGSVRDSGSKFFRLALRRGKAGPAEMKR